MQTTIRFQNKNIFGRAVLLFLVSVISVSSLAAGEWKEGETLERSGETKAAREFYSSWLAENPDSDDYFTVLTHFLLLQETRADFLQQVEKEWKLGTREYSDIYRLAGRQAELSGDPALAKSWYTRAYNKHPFRENLVILLEAAQMDLLMGDYDSARKTVEFIIREDKEGGNVPSARLLLSRIKFLTGDAEGSFSLWQELYAQQPSSRETVLWGLMLSAALERQEMKAELERVMIREFPEEGAAILDSRWKEPRNPDNLLGLYNPENRTASHEDDTGKAVAAADAEPRTDEPLPVPEASEPGTPGAEDSAAADRVPEAALMKIQTGAFRDRDNADEQVRDLTRLGFAAEIITAVSGGADIHRVFITELTEDRIGPVLSKLREHGFDGFPVH